MEMQEQNVYDQVKVTKSVEIQAGQSQINKKNKERVRTDEANAAAKQDLTDTKAKFSEDEKFLMMLKELCAKVDRLWSFRPLFEDMSFMKWLSERKSVAVSPSSLHLQSSNKRQVFTCALLIFDD